MPDEIATPHPRFARDRWPERLAGRAVRCGRRPRQAPVPALRGRPDDPLAPAHDRLVARLARGQRWPRSPRARVAGAPPRRARGRAVRRPGARADDRRRARASTSGIAGLGPGHPRAGARRGDASCAGCARTTRRARSATRCSTSARSPGSGTCGRSRAASRPGSTRGGPTGEVSDEEALRDRATRPGRACSSPRATATRRASGTIYGRAGRPCPRCGGARDPARAARGTTTARPTGARGARR